MNRSTDIGNPNQAPAQEPDPAFHGAAIIDEQGREIPITESMVRQACARLEQAWTYPATPKPRGQ